MKLSVEKCSCCARALQSFSDAKGAEAARGVTVLGNTDKFLA